MGNYILALILTIDILEIRGIIVSGFGYKVKRDMYKLLRLHLSLEVTPLILII